MDVHLCIIQRIKGLFGRSPNPDVESPGWVLRGCAERFFGAEESPGVEESSGAEESPGAEETGRNLMD